MGRGGGEQPLAGCAGVPGTSASGEVSGAMDHTAGNTVVRCVVVAGIAMLAGCTMCPDPYDYSGPVPNGSAPQNDFRARSNGILPLNAAPRPWPPVVRDDAGDHDSTRIARRSGTPTPAPDAVTAAVAEVPTDPAEARSVLVVIAEQAPVAGRDPWAVVPDFGGMPVAGEVRDPGSATPAEAAVSEQPARVPDVTVVVPRLTETPGWRERRPR